MFRKMFTLSFDDGTVQDRRFIELIDRYNLRATFNLNSGYFGQKHDIIHDGINVCHDEVDKEEVKALYRNHEIAVHTVTHPNLKACDDERVLHEVKDDYAALSALGGKRIVGMAYPCGGDCFDERVKSLITENTPIRYARTTASHKTFALPKDFMEWNPTCHQNDPDLFKLAEEFINAEPSEDMLFYLWGHSFEFDKFGTWDVFERFCEQIAGKRDITYMTNGEVYGYLTKRACCACYACETDEKTDKE